MTKKIERLKHAFEEGSPIVTYETSEGIVLVGMDKRGRSKIVALGDSAILALCKDLEVTA